jgi:hypothetical protein
MAFWIVSVQGILAIGLGAVLLFQPDRTLPMLANFMGLYWLTSGVISLRWAAAARLWPGFFTLRRGGRRHGPGLPRGLLAISEVYCSLERNAGGAVVLSWPNNPSVLESTVTDVLISHHKVILLEWM